MNTETELVEKNKMDDLNGNCKKCGHLFDPHVVIAYDINDFSKGGEIRCPVSGCDCFHTTSFDFAEKK
ncbi:MAG: hypothetical protein KA028_01525 [Candidatus Pacebacteria bacterium]|nr:hypothetical protein [Candidatus Paceibacterota bacterium]MBP9851711.1 hypothetical protein [Candidatus Paceibacterota bacterium]